MIWILIALLSPLLYAITNHVDKYLLSNYFQDRGVGSLIIFSGLFSVFALPIIYLVDRTSLQVSGDAAFWLTMSGTLTVLSILCYLYALKIDEASVVVPFYQTIPVFSYFLGFLLLGEVLGGGQIVGSLFILAGAFFLSFDLESGSWRFRRRVVFLMLLASFLYAVNGAVFKFFALELGFWPSLFWDSVGKVAVGLFFFFFIAAYRHDFLRVFRRHRGTVLTLNAMSEILTILADSIAGYAFLLAPLALVSVVLAGFQPVFVLVLGVALTLFFPRLGRETLTRRSLIQRFGALALIIIGVAFLA